MQQNKVGEQKFYKKFGHFSLALLILTTSVNGESFADFKRSQAKSFNQYKDERDNQFNKYLKQQWQAYNVYMGKKMYEVPKPKYIAPTKATQLEPVGPKVFVKIKKIKPKPHVFIPEVIPLKKEVKKIATTKKPVILIQKDEIDKKASKKYTLNHPTKNTKIVVKEIEKPKIVKYDINFDFFGTKLGFNIPIKIQNANFYPQNQNGIASFFDSAASSDYNQLVREIKNVHKAMNLNDWGLYLLVLKISNQVFKENDNANLLSWFLFNKLGYSVKIGLAHNHTILLFYSKKIIYSTPNYNFGKKKYYVLSHYAKGSVGKLYSYKQNYPNSTRSLDLSLKTLPYFKDDLKKKVLSFSQYGKKYEIPFLYNKNLIDFMQTYPQADYETFFNAPLDQRTYNSIAKGLKKYIDGKQTGDAMNFVLHFVQKSFKYSRDDVQFQREKVMFAEETLYFNKSDCEDRAVLFSYLIEELFGINAVGVHYKGHMATALYAPMKGDFIQTGTKKLVIADPTYINANIGQAMPQYKSVKPKSLVRVNVK